MLISPEYVEQNRQLHEAIDVYGPGGIEWARPVVAICASLKTKNVLDYGCGKGSLVRALQEAGFDAYGYDPCVDGYAVSPDPADVVVCTDVLEHIEPEHLDDVLEDLERLTKKALYLIISTRPALKILPDGRNAHLSLMPGNEWLRKLLSRFNLLTYTRHKHGLVAVLEK